MHGGLGIAPLDTVFRISFRISSKRHCGYYLFQLYCNAAIRGWATIRSTDIAATIYFSSTAMQLFEGGLLFEVQMSQLLFISALPQRRLFEGRLLFEVQTSWLLFISALPQCGDYSRAATIRSTDVAATIYFSATSMQRLFEGGYYSRYRRRGYYLFQLYRNAATIRGRLLFKVRRLFEEIRYSTFCVQYYTLRE